MISMWFCFLINAIFKSFLVQDISESNEVVQPLFWYYGVKVLKNYIDSIFRKQISYSIQKLERER